LPLRGRSRWRGRGFVLGLVAIRGRRRRERLSKLLAIAHGARTDGDGFAVERLPRGVDLGLVRLDGEALADLAEFVRGARFELRQYN